ncbi:bifunctional demethylmenaquinone methyltransferase/2-methoxy-6-polyprenyl-1,4-benzoquinol methylase UbiE [Oligella ureolytica]
METQNKSPEGSLNQELAEDSTKQIKSTAETHFGYSTVSENEKEGRVAEVFHSVASKYDIMNDLMSGGLHRVWKQFTIGKARLREGMKVLDIASGTGDLALAFAKRVGQSGGGLAHRY